tara:strand:+ start:14151 stop:14396 length:246 start_codon:yes stop_codon:yes gene_type:complete
MKRGIFIVLVLLSVVAIRCQQDPRNDACYDPDLVKMMKDSTCALSCQGVCACNGATYCNECEAMKAGFAVAPGDTVPCSQK